MRPSIGPKQTESASPSGDNHDTCKEGLFHKRTRLCKLIYACGYYSGGKERNNWADVAMLAINNHLQWFRMLPWVMGGVGMLVIAKYSGMVL